MLLHNKLPEGLGPLNFRIPDVPENPHAIDKLYQPATAKPAKSGKNRPFFIEESGKACNGTAVQAS
jgi:hypothetical protein